MFIFSAQNNTIHIMLKFVKHLVVILLHIRYMQVLEVSNKLRNLVFTDFNITFKNTLLPNSNRCYLCAVK